MYETASYIVGGVAVVLLVLRVFPPLRFGARGWSGWDGRPFAAVTLGLIMTGIFLADVEQAGVAGAVLNTALLMGLAGLLTWAALRIRERREAKRAACTGM